MIMSESKMVAMSAEELREFNAYREAKAMRDAELLAKAARDQYRVLVDGEIDGAIPALLSLSEGIRDTKRLVLDSFRSILDMKAEVMGLSRDDQRSHTFTHSDGKKRIIMGVYVTDAYRDTVNDGILIVREYIESLAKDADSLALVKAVLRLLSRDNEGNLKASRVLQLRMMAEESGNGRFREGVRIIEESYQPAISKQFIRVEVRDDSGAWVAVPLGMTEA